jgi:transposase
MEQTPPNGSAEQHVREIRRQTRKKYSSEENIRIVISGLRGEHSIAELYRREGIAESLYYAWSKEFLEAGKKRLSGDTERQASSGEVKDLRREMGALKELVADLTIENRLLKEIRSGMGETANEVPGLGEARDHPAGRELSPVPGFPCKIPDSFRPASETTTRRTASSASASPRLRLAYAEDVSQPNNKPSRSSQSA